MLSFYSVLVVSSGSTSSMPCFLLPILQGVLAATVRDAALAYAVMSPTQPGHFYTRLYGGDGPPAPHLQGFRAAAGGKCQERQCMQGVRLGFFRAMLADAEEDIQRSVERAMQWMEQCGATLLEIEPIPHMHWLGLSHALKISSEFALRWVLHGCCVPL